MAVGIPQVPQLAGETNYPAGGNPWNGTPIKVAPGVDYSTPNTKPPAQSFNYWLNLLSAQALANQNLSVSGAVANFDTVIAGTTIDASLTALPFVFWQPWSQKWIAVVQDGTTTFKTYWTHDNGRTWTIRSHRRQGNSVWPVRSMLGRGGIVGQLPGGLHAERHGDGSGESKPPRRPPFFGSGGSIRSVTRSTRRSSFHVFVSSE